MWPCSHVVPTSHGHPKWSADVFVLFSVKRRWSSCVLSSVVLAKFSVHRETVCIGENTVWFYYPAVAIIAILNHDFTLPLVYYCSFEQFPVQRYTFCCLKRRPNHSYCISVDKKYILNYRSNLTVQRCLLLNSDCHNGYSCGCFVCLFILFWTGRLLFLTASEQPHAYDLRQQTSSNETWVRGCQPLTKNCISTDLKLNFHKVFQTTKSALFLVSVL